MTENKQNKHTEYILPDKETRPLMLIEDNEHTYLDQNKEEGVNTITIKSNEIDESQCRKIFCSKYALISLVCSFMVMFILLLVLVSQRQG